jgi:hypothetical protein
MSFYCESCEERGESVESDLEQVSAARAMLAAELAEARGLLREAYNAHAQAMTVGLCYRLAHFLARPHMTGTIGNIYGASSMPEGK